MEQNEQKKKFDPIFVEPEMIEEIPLSRAERLREKARGLRRRIRLPQIRTVLMFAAAALVLLALIAAPILPGIALAVMLVKCCRSAFRAQTA